MLSSEVDKIREQIQEILKNRKQNPELEDSRELEEISQKINLLSQKLHAGEEELEELKQRNDLLETVTDNMSDLVALTDPEGHFNFLGKSHEILGFEPDFLTGKNVIDFVHHEDLPRVMKVFQEFIKNPKKKEKIEYRYRKADGTYLWLETVAKMINNGKELLFSSRNITNRREAEEARKESDNKFRIIAENGEEVFWLRNAENTKMLYINPAYETIWGRSCEGLYQNPNDFISSVHEEDRQMVITNFKKYAQTGKFNLEYRIVRPGGEIRWIRARTAPIKNDAGIISGHTGLAIDITGQKNLELELENAKEQFELAIEGTNDGIWDWNLRTNSLFLSKRWKEMLGYQDHELKNQYATFTSLICDEDREKVNQCLNNYLKGKTSAYLTEFRMKHKDGSLRWILARGKAIRDDKGIPFRMAGSHGDITESKIAGQEILETKEKLELSLNSGYIAWWIWDYETGIVQADPKKAEMLGYTAEEFPKNVHEITRLVHPEDYEPMMQSMRNLLDGVSDKYEIDYRIKTKAGRWRWFFDRGTIVGRSPEGKPKKISGVVTDITERKEADAELKRMVSLQQILMNMASEYINLDIDDTEAGINRSLAELGRFVGADRAYIFEYDWEKELTNNTCKWCAPDISPQIEILQQLPMSAVSQWVETHKKGKAMKIADVNALPGEDGVRKMLEPRGIKSLIAVPMMDNEKCLGFVGFDSVSSPHDFTEEEKNLLLVFSQILVNLQKRSLTEQNLIREKEKARAANSAKSVFLANMSHEIRTPMNSILGFSEIMLNITTNPNEKKYLKTILSSGRTLLSLINDILDLSKIEAQKMELSPEPADLRLILNEIKELFQHAILEKNIDFILEMDEQLPPSVVIDEVRLKQILLNIAGNAVKFTHEGFVKISLKILHENNGIIDLRIDVTDTGIGIPKEYQGRIFESFSQQSARNSRKYGGTGLGLAISKKLCELMKGKIEVESTPGKGSRFTLTFTNLKYADEITEDEALFLWDEESINFKGSKILIVDDVSHNRELALAFLNNYDLLLYEAENGEMAVEMAGAIIPDLIFMDLRMPFLSGYEATEEIRKNRETADIPIVALTASVMQNEKEKLQQLFNGYLRKPVMKKSLINEMIKHLPYDESGDQSSGETTPSIQVSGTGEISEKVKEAFKEKFSGKITNLSTMIIIDDLALLITGLRDFAREHQIDLLRRETDNLEQAVEDFDVEKIRKCLNTISQTMEP